MYKGLQIAQAKEIDLVNYLASLGFSPVKIRGNDYWYLSPLREEKHASFKVNRKLNLWYDHGIGKGGTLISFGMLYHDCSIKELLLRLQQSQGTGSFHQPVNTGKKKVASTGGEASPITIVRIKKIIASDLTAYLNRRKVPVKTARQYCLEVDFRLYGKSYTALGFKNDAGGYELRNAFFKGSSRPKSPTLIKGHDSAKLSVFEGFFSFLSYVTMNRNRSPGAPMMPGQDGDILVLNSLSYFEKSRPRMESYPIIHLYLDRDRMGILSTEKALHWSPRYTDQSHFCLPYKDLNEKLVHQKPGQKLRKQ